MIDQEADAILSAHTSRPLSLCKYCRSGEHRKGKYGCLSWADCECQTCMEEPKCTVALNADKPATAAGTSMTTTPRENGTNPMSASIASARTANPTGPMKKEPEMSATPPAVRATDLEKRLEGLTPEDLHTAVELDEQAKPLLAKLVEEKVIISRYQEEKITDWMHDAGRISKILWDFKTPRVREADKLHKDLVADRAADTEPFDAIEADCKALIALRDEHVKREEEAAQRERERIAYEEEAARKKADLDAHIAAAAEAEKAGDHETAQMRLETAHEIEQMPVVPVVMPKPAALPPVKGSSTSYRLVGTVKNARALLEFLLDGSRDDLINELVDFKQSGINAALRRGLTLPGVSVTKEPIVRNLGRK